MRVMVIVKATGRRPARCRRGLLTEDDREELVKAGIMLAGEGLGPARPAACEVQRCLADGGRRTILETKELIAGYWLWQVKSMEEAVEWVKRCPNPMPGDSEIEIRQVFETTDFPEATPEILAKEKELSAQIAARAQR